MIGPSSSPFPASAMLPTESHNELVRNLRLIYYFLCISLLTQMININNIPPHHKNVSKIGAMKIHRITIRQIAVLPKITSCNS